MSQIVSWLFRRERKQPLSADQATLDQLAKAGGNLKLPTDVVNYLYLPDESRARQAGAKLEQAGYQVKVRPAATGSNWLALANMDMVPSAENVARMRALFESLGSEFGGDYDGWEAAVTG